MKTSKYDPVLNSLVQEQAHCVRQSVQMERRLVECIVLGDLDGFRFHVHEAIADGVELSRVRDDDGQSLVHIAIRYNRVQVLEMLLLLGCSSQEDEHPHYDKSPLCMAVEHGQLDCLCVLVAHGAVGDAPSVVDGSLQTPLHMAAIFDVDDRILEALLSSSIDVDCYDLHENTPLHLAAAYGSYRAAQSLITTGASINAVNAAGSTPLHLASANGFDDIVQLLLGHGVDVNALDVLGNTPLIDAAFVNQSAMGHFACGDLNSQSRVIQLLLDRGAEVNACNQDGDPAIYGAIRHGYTDIVLALLDRGASVVTQNRHQETVLHIAARAGIASVQTWKRLLIAGADILARDRYDRTCYCIWMSRPKPMMDEQPEDEDLGDVHKHEIDGDRVTRLLEAALMTQ